MTIPAADVRTPIVTPVIAIISIGTAIAVVTIRAIAIAIIPIGTIAMAVVAVPAAVISAAICTPVDASNAPGC
jgi:hypothetical protein